MPRFVRTRLVLQFATSTDGWSFLSRDEFSVMLGECRDERPASELGDHSYGHRIQMGTPTAA